MFDETNYTEEQEPTLPEKLFESDEAPTNDEGITEDHNDDAKDTLTIKYNGEERNISLDEARILAQKGMNYDHVVAERDTKYKRELDFLDKVAAREGLSRTQYIAMQEATDGKSESRREDLSPRERAAAQLRRITDSVGMTGPWSALFNKYPTLSRHEAYSELSESVAGGLSPIEAYQDKLLSEKDRMLRIARESELASRKSVGSLESDGSGSLRDEFLEGFSMYN